MIFLFLELPPGALRVDKMLTMYVEIMPRFIKGTNVKGNAMWEEHPVDLASHTAGPRTHGLLLLAPFKKIHKILQASLSELQVKQAKHSMWAFQCSKKNLKATF